MELLRVKMEDVFPDESNPRRDFGDLEALAESFTLNRERPGEPFTPPILVRDGGIYRIVDGERRYRALKSIHATEFWANVCEDMDEADSVVAMLATDDKMPLTEVERSRGVQKMLLLGVDPDRADRAARLKKGTSNKVATARALADEAGDDMTLDQMLAIAEFADQPGIVDRLLLCHDQTEFDNMLRRARRDREVAEKVAAWRQAAAEAGVELLDYEDPDLREGRRFRYDLRTSQPADIARIHAEEPDVEFALCERNAMVYPFSPDEDDGDPEREELELAAARLRDSMEAAFKQISSWFEARCLKVGAASVPHLRDVLVDGFEEAVDYGEVEEAFPSLADIDKGYSRVDYAVGYLQRFPWSNPSHETALGIVEGKEMWATRSVPDMAQLFELAAADGFRFDEESLPAKAAVEAFAAAAEGGE